jgi:hypothetical protein
MPEVNINHGLPEETPRFYAKTRFWQDGEEFVCVPPFECQKKMDPTHDEVLGHLLEILRHNDYVYWGKDGVSFKKSALKFGELSFKQVAAGLADPLSNQPVNGITYEISTRWEEVGEVYNPEKHQGL